MAGDDNGKRISADRSANSPRGPRLSHQLGDITIRGGGAVGNKAHLTPHCPLERGAPNVQGALKAAPIDELTKEATEEAVADAQNRQGNLILEAPGAEITIESESD